MEKPPHTGAAEIHLETGTQRTRSEDACCAFLILRSGGWQLEWIVDALILGRHTSEHYTDVHHCRQDVERLERKRREGLLGTRTSASEELAQIRLTVVEGRRTGALSRSQAAVLDGLLQSADLRNSRTFACSQRDLVLATGLGRRSIRRVLDGLIASGWLEKAATQSGVRGHRSTWHLPRKLADATECAHSPVSTGGAGGRGEVRDLGNWGTHLSLLLGGGDAVQVLRVLVSLPEDEEITRRQLHEQTGVPLRTVQRLCRQLAQEGLTQAGLRVRLRVCWDGLEEAAEAIVRGSERGQQLIERLADARAEQLEFAGGRSSWWAERELEWLDQIDCGREESLRESDLDWQAWTGQLT